MNKKKRIAILFAVIIVAVGIIIAVTSHQKKEMDFDEFVGLIHTQHLSLKSLRKISRPISAENDAGSFDVNTCTRTRALQILTTILRFVFT